MFKIFSLLLCILMCTSSLAQNSQNDFYLKSEGAKLAARFSKPAGDGPFPAVVIVHGSGEAGWGLYSRTVTALNRIGLAVLYYDKRGTNSSEGKYKGISPGNSIEMFDLLSSDALAAVEWLKTNDSVIADRVGVYGSSQGGWIITQAASRSNDVKFVISVSGPVATLGQEYIYSKLAGDERRKRSLPQEEIYTQTRDYKGNPGFDPSVHILKINAPAIWFIGTEDASMPPRLSVENLKKIQSSGKKNIFYKTYEGYNHSLVHVETGRGAPLFKDIKEWLDAKVFKE